MMKGNRGEFEKISDKHEPIGNDQFGYILVVLKSDSEILGIWKS